MPVWKDASDAAAFVQRYSGMILRLCFTYSLGRADAQDICQNVFLKLLQSDRSFDSEGETRAFIIRMTVNEFGEMMNGLGIVVNEITPDNNRLKVWNAAQPVRHTPAAISKPPKEPKYKTRRELQKMSGNDLVDYLVQCCQYFNCTINTIAKAAWELIMERPALIPSHIIRVL